MAQLSGFWTTSSGARAGDQQVSYTQSQLAQAYKVIAACSGFEGVAPGYMNELLATVPSNNTVTINTGGAMVDGHWFYLDAPINKTIASATGAGNTRIDRIVLRCIWGTTFKADIVVLPGVNAATPSPPAITKTSGTTYDITLWQAKVTTGGVVTLTDERVWAKNKDVTVFQLKVVPDGTLLMTGTGKLFWTIPEPFDGYQIKRVDCAIKDTSSSGAVTLDVLYDGVSVLPTKPSIPAGQTTSYVGTRGVTNSKVVSTGGKLRFDITAAGTNARGLEAILVLEQ